MPGFQVHGGQFGVAQDGGQQVVEVVRYAAGEAADALHLLGVRQLGLEGPPLGYVLQDAVVADQPAVLGELRHRRAPHPPHHAVLAHDAVLHLAHSLSRLHLPGLLQDQRLIVGLDHRKPQVGIRVELRG